MLSLVHDVTVQLISSDLRTKARLSLHPQATSVSLPWLMAFPVEPALSYPCPLQPARPLFCEAAVPVSLPLLAPRMGISQAPGEGMADHKTETPPGLDVKHEALPSRNMLKPK